MATQAQAPVRTVADWKSLVAEATQVNERTQDGVTIELLWNRHVPNQVFVVATPEDEEQAQVTVVPGFMASEAYNHPALWLPKPELLWPS